MQRDFRFDVARSVCMCYIIAVLHLSQYLGIHYYIYETFIGRLVTYSCLGLFTFMSGYLIGKKNDFTKPDVSSVLKFYKKRFIRIYPLFVIATILLYVINFNGLMPSVYGLLGIAPFVIQQPKTLWYVSMLVIFYLLTPLINRNSLWYKMLISGLLVLVFGLIKLFVYVDTRFIFNLFFYCFGLIMSQSDFSILTKSDDSDYLTHILTISFYMALIYLASRYYPGSVALLSVGAFGVAALFSFSCLLSKLKNKVFIYTISFVSYASMVCYMLHRFYYWCGLEAFEPEVISLKTTYLILVFIVGLTISYYVQKGYDKIIQHVK